MNPKETRSRFAVLAMAENIQRLRITDELKT